MEEEEEIWQDDAIGCGEWMGLGMSCMMHRNRRFSVASVALQRFLRCFFRSERGTERIPKESQHQTITYQARRRSETRMG